MEYKFFCLNIQIRLVDINKDGKLSFEELVSFIKNGILNEGLRSEKNARDMFKLFDLNDDGFVSIDEFKSVTKTFEEDFDKDEVDELFKGKNGVLSVKGNKIHICISFSKCSRYF